MSYITDAQLLTPAQAIFKKRRANRAKRACLSCRSRKVRCDVTRQSPSSCSNCIWNSTECVVIEPRKPPWVPQSIPAINLLLKHYSTRKKRTAHIKQEKEVRQNGCCKNKAKETTPDTPLLNQCQSLGQIEYPDFMSTSSLVILPSKNHHWHV